MRKKIVIVLGLIFMFSFLVPHATLAAYKKPTDAQKKEVQDKINEGNREADATKKRKLRQEAIELADKYYTPDNSNVKGEPKYDPSVSGEGVADKRGNVKIGEDAFSSPGWLATSKMHEFLHCDQAKDGRWVDTTKGENMNETEAYDKELKEAKKSGLTKDEIDEIKKRRKGYYDGLTAANKRKVDGGDYTVAMVVPVGDAVALGLANIDFVGQGRAAGNIFDLVVTRLAKNPFTLEISLGTPISPGVDGVQTMMVGGDVSVPLTGEKTTVPVTGYCLNPELLPPPTSAQIEEGKPSPTWTFVNPWEFPELYFGPMNIITTGNQLSGDEKFHTDMPVQKYLETVVQRALWFDANPEDFGKEKLQEDLTEQIEESGGKQTPEQIGELTEHLWEDIDLTLKESKNKEPS